MKETLIRSLRTFFQAFAGYLVVNLSAGLSGVTDGAMLAEPLTALIAAGIAAGLAAVMNMPKKG